MANIGYFDIHFQVLLTTEPIPLILSTRWPYNDSIYLGYLYTDTCSE